MLKLNDISALKKNVYDLKRSTELIEDAFSRGDLHKALAEYMVSLVFLRRVSKSLREIGFNAQGLIE